MEPHTARTAADEARRAAWGRWLSARVAERRLTWTAVGAACGVAHTTALRWGQGRQPPLDVARPLARVLGVSVRELVERAEGR